MWQKIAKISFLNFCAISSSDALCLRGIKTLTCSTSTYRPSILKISHVYSVHVSYMVSENRWKYDYISERHVSTCTHYSA